jgi:hypothetical protein
LIQTHRGRGLASAAGSNIRALVGRWLSELKTG